MKRWMTAAAALLAAAGMSGGAETPAAGWALEPLPYAFDALEPHIDAATMEIHYTRHHQAYFQNLARAAEGSDLAGKPLEAVLAEVGRLPAAVRNNGGGHYNHTLFWKNLSPTGGGRPTGALAARLEAAFGSFEQFQAQFKQAALGRFGSGWVWLCVGADGALFVTSTPNQDNPLMDVAERRGRPILGLDVWEHAYYLKYRNRRDGYIDAFWNVVNWADVAARLEAAGKAP